MTEASERSPEQAGGDGSAKRERSSIAFPYQDLGDALEAARAIYNNVATGSCEEAQLAAWLGTTPTSSAFRVRLSTARLFGLIDGGGSAIRCTELGVRSMDPQQERGAKVDAFLRVPLFASLYERFKSTVLPSQAAALEREIASLGVADKQKDRARQVFMRSAEQAGFFNQGKERLVKPGITQERAAEPPPPSNGNGRGDGVGYGDGRGGGTGDGSGGSGLNLDPLLMAVLKLIPSTSEEWPAAKRLRWFKAFAMNVSQVYDHDDPVELDIKLAEQNNRE